MTKITKAEERVQTALSALINGKHPVAIAVEAQRAVAIDRAENFAKLKISKAREELKEAGSDLNVVAPRSREQWGFAAMAAQQRHSFFNDIVRWRNGTWSSGPLLVDIDPKLVAKFINKTKKEAAFQYDAFIVKLCTKIGTAKTATLQGDHIWNESILTIKKHDGSTEHWKTKQIENVSKLGRYFPQWPSRKLK